MVTFATIFWECVSKILTVALVWVHGLLHTACAAEPWHIVAGVRFHWSLEERRFQCERFRCRAASAREWRCAPRTERNGGFGFQTKMKDRFLNQRRRTCWYSCGKKVLSATASLVLLFFLFSFWKACYLCRLPHVTVWRLSLIFFYYYLFDSSVFAKHSVIY